MLFLFTRAMFDRQQCHTHKHVSIVRASFVSVTRIVYSFVSVARIHNASSQHTDTVRIQYIESKTSQKRRNSHITQLRLTVHIILSTIQHLLVTLPTER